MLVLTCVYVWTRTRTRWDKACAIVIHDENVRMVVLIASREDDM